MIKVVVEIKGEEVHVYASEDIDLEIVDYADLEETLEAKDDGVFQYRNKTVQQLKDDFEKRLVNVTIGLIEIE